MALSIVTLIFNIILIIQHYVLYTGNAVPELRPQQTDEKQHLISNGGSDINSYHSINVDEMDVTTNPSFSPARSQYDHGREITSV